MLNQLAEEQEAGFREDTRAETEAEKRQRLRRTEEMLKENYGVDDISDAFPMTVTKSESRKGNSVFRAQNPAREIASILYTEQFCSLFSLKTVSELLHQ